MGTENSGEARRKGRPSSKRGGSDSWWQSPAGPPDLVPPPRVWDKNEGQVRGPWVGSGDPIACEHLHPLPTQSTGCSNSQAGSSGVKRAQAGRWAAPALRHSTWAVGSSLEAVSHYGRARRRTPQLPHRTALYALRVSLVALGRAAAPVPGRPTPRSLATVALPWDLPWMTAALHRASMAPANTLQSQPQTKDFTYKCFKD